MEETKDSHSDTTTQLETPSSIPKPSTETTSPLNPQTNETMEITHHPNRSLLTALMHTFIRPFGPLITKMRDETPEALQN